MMPVIMLRPLCNQNLSFLALIGRGVALGLLTSLLATGCVHRINIQQGNFLDADKVEQVIPGMTRSQVRYLLGTPLAATPFDVERWDYVYFFRRGHSRKVEERKLSVFFEEDKVTRIERPQDSKNAVNLSVSKP